MVIIRLLLGSTTTSSSAGIDSESATQEFAPATSVQRYRWQAELGASFPNQVTSTIAVTTTSSRPLGIFRCKILLIFPLLLVIIGGNSQVLSRLKVDGSSASVSFEKPSAPELAHKQSRPYTLFEVYHRPSEDSNEELTSATAYVVLP